MAKKCCFVEQIWATQAALKWTANDLAMRSDVALRTIQTPERGQGLPDLRKNTLLVVAHALTEAGIEFIGTPDDRPGIRIGKPRT